MRIGVPRGLLYFYYYPLWEAFFRTLGVEIVVSTPTSRPLFNRGVVLANDETCLPVKVFFGHVESLREKQVDYIFLPRMVSMEKRTYLCPKLLGFPEVVTAVISDLPPVLTVNFNLRKNSKELDKALHELGKQLGFSSGKIRQAAEAAREAQSRFEDLLRGGQEFDQAVKGKAGERHTSEDVLRIGVLGHAYMLYDRFTSLDIKNKLTKFGAETITPETVDSGEIEYHLEQLPKKMFWSHSKRILGAAYSFIEDPRVQGLVHLSCFGCGPDSMIADMVERACRRRGKPFMVLTLDEHTGEVGLLTRLEAYMDMLRRRVEVENNISAHG